MNLSFVIPVYNERETLGALAEGIIEQAGVHACRILFVDDGSTDGSFEVIRSLQKRLECVDVIRFRRNLGKSAALAAGFHRAQGDIVFTMDADLQDDPREIPRFIEKLDEGYDVVSGWKRDRQDPWHKTLPSRIFNAAVAGVFGLDLHDVNCGFKAYHTEVVKAIPVYGGRHRLIPVLAAQQGYRVAEIEVEHHPRTFGHSKYGLNRLPRGAADALSVWFLGRYRNAPGHLFGVTGLGCASAGVLSLLISCLRALTVEQRFAGLTSGLLGMVLLVGGLMLIGLGFLGELLVRRDPPTEFQACIAEEHTGGAIATEEP
ncbi:MAG TPA: glycosyltransferase [Candidatus Hydrogenedentes bacterium]|nr:glycosyltransferase [Candidatus Hydrogenedentota bacterium]